MKHFRILMFVVLSMLLVGVSCVNKDIIAPPTDFKVPNIEKGVGDNTKKINESASKIRADATSSKILANEIEKKATDEEIKQWATDIRNRSENSIAEITTIDGAVTALNRLHYKLLSISRYLFEVEDQNRSLKDRVLELEAQNAELNKSLDVVVLQSEERMMNVMVVAGSICVVLLGIGIYLLVSGNGPKTGMALIASSLLMISLTYFMRQHPLIVGAVGGVLFVVFLIAMVYQLWAHKKALFETTDTVEKLKTGSWDKLKDQIKAEHSDHTKKLVQEAKAKRLLSK